MDDGRRTIDEAFAELRIRWDALRETIAFAVHPSTRAKLLDEGLLGSLVNDLADAKLENRRLHREASMLRSALDGIDAAGGPRYVGAAHRLVDVANANAKLRERIRELEAAITEHRDQWADEVVTWSGIPGDLPYRYAAANRTLWAELEEADDADE